MRQLQTAALPSDAQGVIPHSWLANGILLTMYGRGFGTAPVLGRLGVDHSLNDVARQLEPARRAIAASSGRPVRLAIHLIYGLATPCTPMSNCLLYLDDTGVDLMKQYIEPAAQRGWLVILDDQLGASNPAAEMQRVIRRGYLAYDNVEVAFDPEFRAAPGQTTPGVPTGSVTGVELNEAQTIMSTYSASQGLPHQKLLLIHQWSASMIPGRRYLRADLPYVQPAVVMDGIGAPHDKTQVYQSLLGSQAMAHILKGLKLFPANPYDPFEHVDTPLLGWDQIFGRWQIRHGLPSFNFLRPFPRIIVMT